jgi:hypothetical protein
MERACVKVRYFSCKAPALVVRLVGQWMWPKNVCKNLWTFVNVWLQSRSLPARGRMGLVPGLEFHRCLCIIDAGNVFISTVIG